jgi:hypothetical protein
MPALYHRFKHSVASIMSSPSRFRFGEIVSFASLKTRSVSALIAGIDSVSNAIDVSCVKPEFARYLKGLRRSDDEVLVGVEARESAKSGSLSTSRSLISMEGSVSGDEGTESVEKSIFTRNRAIQGHRMQKTQKTRKNAKNYMVDVRQTAYKKRYYSAIPSFSIPMVPSLTYQRYRHLGFVPS